MGYKTIKISEDFHEKLKVYCDLKGLKLNRFCESLMRDGFLSLSTKDEKSNRTLILDSPRLKS